MGVEEVGGGGGGGGWTGTIPNATLLLPEGFLHRCEPF